MPRLLAEYQANGGLYTVRLWLVRGRLVLSTCDAAKGNAHTYAPRSEAQGHRWARRLTEVAR